MLTGGDRETLTMEIEDNEEDQKDTVIEHHINKKQKCNEDFHVATGSQFFIFHAKCHAIIRQKTHDGLTSGLWTKKERIGAVEAAAHA